MPSFANDPKTNFFMPISHIYDPIQTSNDSAFDPGLFAFLEATNGDGDANSIPLSPSMMGIPWPSKFPGCRQCKHWETAQRMTKELLYAIYQNYKQEPQDDGKLPVDLQRTSTDKRSLKENELIATAVKSTVYMFPDASPVRAGMIAQSMLLIFLHDDVVEESPVDAEFKRLKLSGELSDGQQRFIEAGTLCLVGHIFYSATSGRYGGARAAL
ncbi:hypothetical protein Aspvir_009913 [Aspergillus viridinutans]|uniref:Uncharacterized protein n=1 Tax=Aspergillus viridinutans TaxID=75553 RepID=A0A9P3F8Y0_ASPVI|nr:uncharacterized protein Aspvir_009913 [Aspergillus viridinutans]GIK05800.1 hypothetical protein Aspvir_009913 [Aspergillus viridinutans]